MLNNLIQNLKSENQDFEYYPTTEKIIKTIFNVINNYKVWLDIGAGKGDFYTKFQNLNDEKKDKGEDYKKKFISKYFVIEKSKILRDLLPKKSIVLGCDFRDNTLIDKRVDYIFCNPPYAEFKFWMIKILEEANFNEAIFLVVPERWEKDEDIIKLIEKRKLKYSILLADDFLDAERKARAKVYLIIFSHKDEQYSKNIDGFDIFLNSLGIDNKKYENESEKKENIENQIVESENMVETLLRWYDTEFEKILSNYKQLGELSEVIFEELGCNLDTIKEALKKRLQGLKNIYWRIVFDRLEPITKNLVSNLKNQILDDMVSRNNIDFNRENIYMLVDYVLKNIAGLIDEQIKLVYLLLAEPKNILNYKSNQRVFKYCGWQYINEENKSFSSQEYRNQLKNVKLDYRIVLERNSSWEIIKDILVIAKNLGFNYLHDYFLNKSLKFEFDNFWAKRGNHLNAGENYTISLNNEKMDELLTFRCYKNGNIHIKLNKEFLKAFNIEASRILGWIHSKNEIIKEMDITEKDFDKYYNSNFKIDNGIKLLKEFKNGNLC
jgi:hypothetical protein